MLFRSVSAFPDSAATISAVTPSAQRALASAPFASSERAAAGSFAAAA